MKNSFALLFACILSLSNIQLCYSSNALTGTTSAAFLKSIGGVRAISLGNAYIGLAEGTDSIQTNPAGLTQIKNFEISSTYSSQLAGITSTNISAVLPFNRSTVAFSFDYQNYGAIEETTISNPGGTGNTFSPIAYVITTSFAQRLTKSLSLGINSKIMRDSINGDNEKGYAIDIGGLWKQSEKLSFGLSAKSIQSEFGKSKVSSSLGIGIAYRSTPFIVTTDYIMPNDNNAVINVGVEYSFNSTLFGRIGYSSVSEEKAGGNLSAGIGIRKGNYSFDYAYVPYGDLGVSHRFSIGITPFGETIPKLSEISISPNTIHLRPGESFACKSQGIDNRGNELLITTTWETNAKFSSIDPVTGIFHAASTGECFVTATSQGIAGKAKVIIK